MLSQIIRHFCTALPGHRAQGLLSGVAIAFGVKLFGAVALFLSHLILARLMGVACYGVYASFDACLGILVLVGTAGFGRVALRYVAAYSATQQWGLLRGVIRQAHKVSLVTGSVVALGLSAVVMSAGWEWTSPFPDLLLVGAAAIPVLTVLNVQRFTFRGFRRIAMSELPASVVRPVILTGLAVGLTAVSSNALTAPLAMALHLVAAFVALALSSCLLVAAFPHGIRTRDVKTRTREWVPAAIQMGYVAGLHVLLRKTDLIMVGWLAGRQAAGTYSAATRLAALSTVGTAVVSPVVAALLSGAYAKGDHSALQRLAIQASALATGIAITVAGAVLLGGTAALGLFGDEFVAGYQAACVLTLAATTNAMAGPTGLIMTMTGKQTGAVVVLTVTAALNTGLNALLIPHFGPLGAALATAAALVFWNTALTVYIWRSMGLRPGILAACLLPPWRVGETSEQ